MINITEGILQSVAAFKTILTQYQEGKIENLKPYASIMGIYKEGPKETYMVRPRIAGGVITVEQLGQINEIARKYQIQIRFTTRQDVQLHSVKLDDLGNVLDDLLQCGLITRGAGGDGVRNVACSPLSGVAQDEVFDVTPYVKAVTNFMLQDPESLKLPRKYKIAFSSSPEDTANATVSDIGFIAKIQNGKPGFEVYAGGGLGGNAQLALPLADFIEAGDALYYAEAMKRIFSREGDRTNRGRARLRFVVQRLGKEAFVNLFYSELKQLQAEGLDLKLSVDAEQEEAAHQEVENNTAYPWGEAYKNIVIPQKQPGYYSVYVHPRKAEIQHEELEQVVSLLASFSYPVSIRLTMTQGFFVRDIKEQDVNALLAVTAAFSSAFNVENSYACVGPTICNFGVNNPQLLLSSILETFKEQPETIKAALPRVLISGCPNSCGQHQKGLIGFTGRKKRTEKGLIETYLLSMGGMVGSQCAKLGENYGEIPTEQIAEFLVKLAKLQVSSNTACFKEFMAKQEEQIKALVEEYAL